MTRLFVALRPPPPVRRALLRAQGGVEDARWQVDEQLHLTLRFVGEVSARMADDLVDALSSVVADGFDLSVHGAGHFERRGRATALWAGVAPSVPLAELQRRIERACRTAGLAPEPRAFVPHITLARVGGAALGSGDWIVRHGDLAAPDWRVRSFRLYESTLHPEGSRYTALAEWPLAPPPTNSR